MRYRYLLFLGALLLVANLKSYSQCDPTLMTDSAEILFDGPVNKFTRDGHLMYAGGGFNTVGRFTGSFIGLDPQSGRGDNLFVWPKVKGATHGAISDGSGNIIIFGAFTKLGDSVRSSLAIINSSGILSSFKATINGSVNAAAIHNGILYIGGYFTQVNGQARNRLAAISLSTGAVTSWDPNITSTDPLPCHIGCMIVDNGLLYIGGAFSHVGATGRKNIAAVNLTTGVATTWAPQAYFSTAPNFGSVKRMLKVNSTLYICGQFDFTGGGSHPEVAALDISTGSASSWNPNPNSAVHSLASSGDTLYIGGVFSLIGTQPRQGFAAFSRSTGNLLPIVINTAKKLSERISSMAVKDNIIYLGGTFDSIGGQFRKNIAAFNRFTASAQSFVSHTNGEVSNMMQSNGKLYIGGNFFSMNMKERRRLAQLDLDADSVTNFRVDVEGEVRALAVNKKRLYIGGDFTKVKDSVRINAAAVDINTQKVLAWNPQADSIVNDITCYKDQIYIGGYFKQVKGQPRNAIARLDSAGNLESWVGITGTENFVNCLEVYKDSLYVGGVFNNLGGSARKCLGAINLTSGLATGWNPASNVSITAMYFMGDTLFTGGLYPTNIAPPTSPTPMIVDVNRLMSYRAATRTVINWSKPVYFDDAIYDIIVTPGDYRGYIAGAFNNVNIGSTAAYRPRLAIMGMPIVPPPPGPADPFPTLIQFNQNFIGNVLYTSCLQGNKLFYGGFLSDIFTGYDNAALFYLPYHIVEASMTTDTNGVCSGQKGTVRVNSTVTYGAVYQWNVNGVDISNPLPYYTFTPNNKDSIYCTVSVPATTCLPAWQDTTNAIVYTVTPTVTPTISIAGPIEQDTGKLVTVKATVINAATGYTIEWFNKGVSMGTTTVDSITYTKGPGTDSIYAIITPRTDTCYVTDTSALIRIEEKPVVGIYGAKGDAGILVYPNPFGNQLWIKGLNEGDVLTVYDVTGRRILSAVATSQNHALSTSGLRPGAYVLKITNTQGIIRKTLLMQKE